MAGWECPRFSDQVPRALCHSPGAEQAAEEGLKLIGTHEKHPSGAIVRADSARFMRGLKPPPPSGSSFSAACKVRNYFAAFTARLKLCPFKAAQWTCGCRRALSRHGLVERFPIAFRPADAATLSRMPAPGWRYRPCIRRDR